MDTDITQYVENSNLKYIEIVRDVYDDTDFAVDRVITEEALLADLDRLELIKNAPRAKFIKENILVMPQFQPPIPIFTDEDIVSYKQKRGELQQFRLDMLMVQKQMQEDAEQSNTSEDVHYNREDAYVGSEDAYDESWQFEEVPPNYLRNDLCNDLCNDLYGNDVKHKEPSDDVIWDNTPAQKICNLGGFSIKEISRPDIGINVDPVVNWWDNKSWNFD
jgi:hypothetical protein